MQQPTLAFRSVFISDLHLGSAGSQANSVRHFLDEIECEYLYLVGDIVDLWVASKSGKWQQEHTNALNTLLKKSEQGAVVRYTPGNHDDAVRRILGAKWGNISVEHSFAHETLQGEKLLVVHGDLFDRSISCKPLAQFGAFVYELMTLGSAAAQNNHKDDSKIDGNKEQKKAGLGNRAKKMLKTWIQRVTHFEERITADALRQGYDGVICGHLHKPAMKKNLMTSPTADSKTDSKIDLNSERARGLYLNCGDWMEHCSAIVEHCDGRLELIFWADLLGTISRFDHAQSENATAPYAESTEQFRHSEQIQLDHNPLDHSPLNHNPLNHNHTEHKTDIEYKHQENDAEPTATGARG